MGRRVREHGHPAHDELCGWRPRAMKYLRFSEERERRVTALLRGLHANDVDPMTRANVALAGTIRGFPSSFVIRDEGLLISSQWSPRPFPLGALQALRIANVHDAFAPLVFVDYGTGWNHQDIGGVGSYIWLLTAGPGFTYRFGPNISGRFDYGFVLQHFGLPAPGGQADLSLQLRS